MHFRCNRKKQVVINVVILNWQHTVWNDYLYHSYSFNQISSWHTLYKPNYIMHSMLLISSYDISTTTSEQPRTEIDQCKRSFTNPLTVRRRTITPPCGWSIQPAITWFIYISLCWFPVPKSTDHLSVHHVVVVHAVTAQEILPTFAYRYRLK